MKIDRRQYLLRASCGIGSSVLGLNWLDQIAQAEVRGEALSGTRQYDAAMMVYYEGDLPRQIRLIPNPATLEPVFVSNLISDLASVLGPERKQGLGEIEMGFIRSMHHGIPVHQFAQKFTTGFWQSPIGFRYPPAASVMAHYFKDHARTTGLPGSVFIRGDTGRGANTQRGAKVPTALEVIGNPSGMDLMPTLLSSSDVSSYRKRRELIEVFSRAYNSDRTESEISGWTTALDQAVELMLKGISADAFTVDKSSLLAAGNDEIYVGWKQRFTLAQQVIKWGVPFLNVGIGGFFNVFRCVRLSLTSLLV